MKNRFEELLLQKLRKEEENAMNESYGLNPDNDPTNYNPWDDPKDDWKDKK